MTLAAWLLGVVAAFAWIYLTLVAGTSRREIEGRFPQYARKIYRAETQVGSNQGGLVRLWVLVTEPSPDPRCRAIFEMRVLALLLATSFLLALFAWWLS